MLDSNSSKIKVCFFLSPEIGVGLAGFGIAFLFLGMLLLFDKGLLAIGNVSYLFNFYFRLTDIVPNICQSSYSEESRLNLVADSPISADF